MGAEVRLGWDNSDLFRGEQAARSRLKRFDDSVTRVGAGAAASLGKINEVLFGIGGSFAVGRVAAEAFQRSVSFDALQKGFTAVVGSVEEAESQLSRLRALAEEPGVEYRQAIALSRDLQAAGFDASQAEQMIRQVGNAIAVMGGSSDDMSNVVDAMKDLVAEGTLVDDKVDRIAERLPQVRQLMKAAFGSASTTEVREMGVSVEQFLDVIVERMGTDIPRATMTTQEAFKKLSDQVDGLMVDMGNSLEAGGVLSGLTDAVKWFRTLDPLDGYIEAAKLEQMAYNGQAKEALEIAQKQQMAMKALAEDRGRWTDMGMKAVENMREMTALLEREAQLQERSAAAAKEKAEAEAQARDRAMNLETRGEVDPSWKKRDPTQGVEKYLQLAQALGWVEEAQRDLNRAEEERLDEHLRKRQEKINLTNATVAAIQQEIEVLRLRAAGEEEAATALETENRLRQEAARLAERTNLTEKEALDLLKQREQLQQQAANRAGADGGAAPGEPGRRRIGPRDPARGRLTRESFGGIDGTTYSGLDNREFRLLDGAKEKAMAGSEVKPAAKQKDPAERLAELLEKADQSNRWLEQIAQG